VIIATKCKSLPRGASRSARWSVASIAASCLALFLTHCDALAGDAKAGRMKANQCQACHGLDGLSKLPEAPHIAGQPEPYLIKALRDYQQGTRTNEMMTLVAKQLKSQDVEDIAAYYSAIEVSVKVPQ
jgi:cytochrome c553